MKRSTALVAAFALLLVQSDLAAQQKDAPKKGEPEPNCTKQACIATVIVPSKCGSGISVAPDPLIVKDKNVEMTWVIASKGWAFDAKGIEVKWPKELAGTFDHKPGKNQDGTSFKVQNKNDKQGVFKYDINLVDKQGTACQLDPTVVNW